MSREQRAQIIDELQEMFSRSSAGVFTDYRGLKTAELGELRRKMRASGVDYRVVKNTLARIAVERAERFGLAEAFEGPVAVVFGYEEITGLAKLLADHIRTAKSTLEIRGGFLGDRLLTAREVETLATLPSREVLISQVMAGIQSPIVAFHNVLAAPLRGMVGVLQARINQLEGV
jgi:large subunit ribosomal protein L10